MYIKVQINKLEKWKSIIPWLFGRINLEELKILTFQQVCYWSFVLWSCIMLNEEYSGLAVFEINVTSFGYCNNQEAVHVFKAFWGTIPTWQPLRWIFWWNNKIREIESWFINKMNKFKEVIRDTDKIIR